MTPTLQEFKKYAETAQVVPVFAELLADMETPVSVFSKLDGIEESFLLESAENIDNWGRYSFIGCGAKAVFTLRDKCGILKFSDGVEIKSSSENGLSPLSPLRDYLNKMKLANVPNLPPFCGGAVGYFGYDCAGLFEKLPQPKNRAKFDDARLAIYDDLIVFDNLRHTVKLVACIHPEEFRDTDSAYNAAVDRINKLAGIFKSSRPVRKVSEGFGKREIRLKSNMSREEFCSVVEKAKEHICAVDAIQIVPSQKFSAECDIDALSAYRALRMINPSPYMFCLRMNGKELVGSSPETLLRFCDGRAEVRPIAGTRKRGKTPNEDIALADELLSNEKERAEHLMLVDLGRNDLSRFCEAGSVQVSDFMCVERYSHVMHLVSKIGGQVKKGVDAFDALAAAFPAGTLSGAPKIRAMKIIHELEPESRGAYGGAVGYVAYGGNMDLAITIRTLQIADGEMSVQAGAGIVYDSNPESEYEETRMKAGAVERAIKLARNLDSLDPNNFSEK